MTSLDELCISPEKLGLFEISKILLNQNYLAI